jgi:hypothetical protein
MIYEGRKISWLQSWRAIVFRRLIFSALLTAPRHLLAATLSMSWTQVVLIYDVAFARGIIILNVATKLLATIILKAYYPLTIMYVFYL